MPLPSTAVLSYVPSFYYITPKISSNSSQNAAVFILFDQCRGWAFLEGLVTFS